MACLYQLSCCQYYLRQRWIFLISRRFVCFLSVSDPNYLKILTNSDIQDISAIIQRAMVYKVGILQISTWFRNTQKLAALAKLLKFGYTIWLFLGRKNIGMLFVILWGIVYCRRIYWSRLRAQLINTPSATTLSGNMPISNTEHGSRTTIYLILFLQQAIMSNKTFLIPVKRPPLW